VSGPAFAILGAKPLFERPLPVGQLYFPSWERYSRAFADIFRRQYYTNQGPLAQRLEEELRPFFGVRHVICVTNATIGLAMAADALQLRGKVILPSFSFIASAHSVSWAGLEPIFCDVDPRTQQIDIDDAARLIDDDVSAIMAVNLWGGASDVRRLAALAADAGISLYFDSAHAVGCRIDDVPIGGFGRLEVFSFHATKVFSAAEGGCICTDDDDLAARLRNIRSSYGAGRPVEVVRTANGRMSEAQAAIALMSLEDFEANRASNEAQYRRYREGLAAVPGLKLVEASGVSRTTFQYVVCEVDATALGLSRDQLMSALRAENVLARRYFHPGIHRSMPYARGPEGKRELPVTDALCASSIQLPIGALVSPDAIDRICDLLARVGRHAPSIQRALAASTGDSPGASRS
jgi:dTDP-4-amino-4,6-dideoxygalactose transaminase